MSLLKHSIDEIEKHLEERKAELEREERPKSNRNLHLADWNKFCDFMDSYVSDVAEGNSVDGDHGHYIYEAACELVYGKDFFKWLNKVNK